MGEGDEWLRVGGVKLGVDGGFEGGFMREPYEEPWGEGGTFHGLQTVPTERFIETVRELHRQGWRVATHAVGDAAIDLVLDGYEAAHADAPIDGLRWVIEHGFIPRDDHFPRMRALGLSVTAQNHLYVAAPSLVKYWGAWRAAWTTPVRSYLDAGIPVSLGTDSPVVPWDPWWMLHHFTTRGTISAGVLDPSQAISPRGGAARGDKRVRAPHLRREREGDARGRDGRRPRRDGGPCAGVRGPMPGIDGSRSDRRGRPGRVRAVTARAHRICLLAGAGLLVSGAAGPAGEGAPSPPHDSDARFVVELEWPRENIARTLGVARSELGMYRRGNPFQTRDIGDLTCVVGPLFALDIDDEFAFDIDEPVDLVVTYAPELTGPVQRRVQRQRRRRHRRIGHGRTRVRPRVRLDPSPRPG